MTHQPTLGFDKTYQLDKEQKIIFTKFPVPPSSNKIYKHFLDKRKGKIIRVSTKDLLNFKRECSTWAKANARLCTQANLYLRDEPHIKVVVYVALHWSYIYTKDGKVRMMDISNRGKALFDCLADAIGVDDRHFTHVSLVKVIADDTEIESCRIEMSRFEIQTLNSLT